MNIPTSRTSVRETILQKWQSVVEERAENCKRTRLDPKETIRRGKSRSDSAGERLCQLFVPTRFF